MGYDPRIWPRCKYCHRTMRVPFESWSQNPFCPECYDDRLTAARALIPDIELVEEGEWLVPRPVARGPKKSGQV